MQFVAPARNDVCGGDELADSPSRGEQGCAGEWKAGGESECEKACGGGCETSLQAAGRDLRDGEAAAGGTAELSQKKQAALLVGQVPAQAQQRENGTEERGCKTRKQETRQQDWRRGAVAATARGSGWRAHRACGCVCFNAVKAIMRLFCAGKLVFSGSPIIKG